VAVPEGVEAGSGLLQRHHALKVACLREEVEGLHLLDLIAVGEEGLEIADLGGGVAGDVDHAFGGEGKELVEKLGAATFAGRVDDDGCFVGGKLDFGKDVFGRGGVDDDVLEFVLAGVLSGPVGGGFRDLDAGHFFEAVREAESEQSGTAVGIDEVGAIHPGLLRDMVREGGEDVGVVLEKVSGEEAEGERAHLFLHDVVRVGVDPAGRRPQQEGGALLVFGGRLARARLLDGERLVDGLHGDGALIEFDRSAPGPLREEADGFDFSVLRFLKVGGDL